MQRWARHMLQAVEGFRRRQRQRAQSERALLAAARRAVAEPRP
jgi:hypothetical protein